ncbi:MAG TPA: hypothetical protein PK821_04080 [Victivallales bacterium]|nr:hypothetical protein [Victivallales bacterium]
MGKLKSPLQQKVQNALQTTWLLKGHLKNAQISYIRVAVGLAKVRDEKLYEVLHHPDIEDYAAKRLNLGRASLYRYLQVHDWIAKYHKEWLEPKPKGHIPDLTDVADMIFIETELSRDNITPTKRTALEKLKEKALDGSLRKGETSRIRKGGGRKTTGDSLRVFLSKLKALRRYGAQIKAMPPEVIAEMDAAIEILENSIATQNIAMVFQAPKTIMSRNSFVLNA